MNVSILGSTLDVSDIDGNFQASQIDSCDHLLLMAAGTGFTPMIRLLYESLVEESNSNR